MSQTINLSLSDDLIKEVRRYAKRDKFKSVNGFIRELVFSFVSDERMLKGVAKSQAEYKAGKAIRFTDLRDLLK